MACVTHTEIHCEVSFYIPFMPLTTLGWWMFLIHRIFWDIWSLTSIYLTVCLHVYCARGYITVSSNYKHHSLVVDRERREPYGQRQGLNWGIPPDLSRPTSAFRSATCNLGSTILKYRSGTFLLGSTIVKHVILTVRWIQCQCWTDNDHITWTAGRDHLAVACAPGH